MKIRIKHAKVNNLKDLSIAIPRNKVVVVTGVSGSGKSSLVFDTVYAEAQRAFMDSLSTYSRISMPKIGKPNVESIEGLSPCLVIDQKPLAKNPRSTVGTVTEIYSYLRMLFSRMGSPVLSAGEFSFNTPLGACECCKGLGEEYVPDLNLLIDYDKSLNQNAIKHRTWKVDSRYWNIMKATEKFDMDKPLKDFSKEEMDFLLYSEPITLENGQPGYIQSYSYQGIISRLIRRQGDSRGLESNGYDQQFFRKRPCSICGGSRLNSRAREVTIDGKSIIEVSNMEITELKKFLDTLTGAAAEAILPYVNKIIEHLIDVGLGYLSISRSIGTLSGGEAQKVKIGKQLGSSLTEIIYVMDEPSSGLHARDVEKISRLLRELVDKNNTVIVVEHNKDMIQAADYVIDIGPGAGVLGGECIAQGTVEDIKNNPKSVSGNMLKEHVGYCNNTERRNADEYLKIDNASEHNLKEVSVQIPKNILTCITGVSGSGKSSLVDVLLRSYPEIVVVDQSAAGSNSRSNLVTYVQAFDAIRNEFAKACDVSASLFTFNGEGACRECNGTGYQVMDMHFLGEIKNICPECHGKRYKAEVLAYRYKGLTIADALELTVAEAIDFFEDKDVKSKCKMLKEVGLEYLTIGQSMDTLSGGERQRLKLAKFMSRRGKIYVLDEPTRGLSSQDINKLLELFQKLVNKKNTIILIEHHLKVIRSADFIIDLGPEGGKKGGRIVTKGTPEEVAKVSRSYTGKYLAKNYFEQDGKNVFLNMLCQKLRKDRPVIPDKLNYTLWTDTDEQKFVQVWVKTKGCRHTYTGGCSMCDYWLSPKCKEEDIPQYLEEALGQLGAEPEKFLLNTCGSVFDEWEMSDVIRNKVFTRLAQFKKTQFILETHLDTITEEKVKQCRQIFAKNQLQFEVGFESADWWVQKYCMNKPMTMRRVKETIALLKKYQIGPIFNILIGTPFLSLKAMYEDAIKSIQWIIKEQDCDCVIFPVNMKEWTLVERMSELGLYRQPSLWLFIEVLTHLAPEILDRVEISWYKQRPKYIEDYKVQPKAPGTCAKCEDKVIALLDEYVDSEERKSVVERLSNIQCECRTKFLDTLRGKKVCNQMELLRHSYKVLGQNILGKDWWKQNGAVVWNSIDHCPWEKNKVFDAKNDFLDDSGKIIRKDAERYWDNNHFSIREWMEDERKEGGIWFKTMGCSHEWSGGCIMCDYSFGSKTSCDEMIQCVKEALSQIKDPCYNLIITPSGSMLDEREVPEETRIGILKLFKESKNKYLGIESRADTVDPFVIRQCKEILGERFKRVYIGMECSNQWILKYCINKNQDIANVQMAFQILTEQDVEIIANVLVGIPFLTPKENVTYAVESVKWAIENGCTGCCIFPVHVKEHTQLEKLTKTGGYQPTSLWTYIEVIQRLKDEIREGKVTIDWFETYEAYNIVYPARTCDNCYMTVLKYLRTFTETKDFGILEQLEQYQCSCKEEWKKEFHRMEEKTLAERVEEGYRKLAASIESSKWQGDRLEEFLRQMRTEYKEW